MSIRCYIVPDEPGEIPESREMRLCGACNRPAPTYIWVDRYGRGARLYAPHEGVSACAELRALRADLHSVMTVYKPRKRQPEGEQGTLLL